MKKSEFFFESRDGKSSLHAVRYTPEETQPVRGVIQIVHGMAEHMGRYEELAEYLVERGFVVTGDDHLGHGDSVAEGNPYGYFCDHDPATVVVRDVHRLKKMTQNDFPGVPYIMLGHSMGSFITRNYMFRYGTGIDAVILTGTGMQPKAAVIFFILATRLNKVLFGPKHVAKITDGIIFGTYNKREKNPRTAVDWLSRDEKKVDEYIADPKCGFPFTISGFETLFSLVYRVEQNSNLEKIPKDLPVLFVSGAKDQVGECGKGVERSYQSLVGAGLKNVEKKLYPGAKHEVFNETNRKEIMDFIGEWIEKTLYKNAR